MATFTREDLVKAVLGELCQTDPNEDVEASDFATVNARCQQVLELLYEDGKLPFDIGTMDIPTTVIPARYFLPLTWKVSRTLINTYSAQDRAEALAANDVEADRMLNRLQQAGYVATTTQANYF
jgi:hypothetical protein